jgi:hypothetical protein
MLSDDEKCEHFDYQFYLKTYTDLVKAGITTQGASYSHYKHHGLKEGRTGSLYEMRYSMNLNKKVAAQQCESFRPQLVGGPTHLMNILVRTSNRPNSFMRCIKSIFEQSYQNFHVYVCYDKIESLYYLEQYEGNAQITCFPVYVKSDEKYKFNLYCNKLMDKVQEGYILFLDDDDKLMHHHVLAMLNDEMGLSDANIIIGQFMRPDKLIYLTDIKKDIILGEIDTSSACFHHSLKRNIRWDDKQCGDFRFFSNLINPLPRSNIKQCNVIIASTQFDDKIGHYGENEI